MFYTLSKALLFLIQPTVWITAIILAAFLTRSRRVKKRRAIAALILYLIFGNSALFNWTMQEIEFSRSSLDMRAYEYGILLGGYGEFNTNSGSIELFSSGDRLTETLALYHQGKIEKIIVSSGVHEEGHPDWSESLISKELLERCGVPSGDIILENESWNTYQNAQYTRSILEHLGNKEEVLLISSAFHMKRAIACFEKQGIQVNPYPVDYYSDDDPVSWSYYVLPNLRTAIDWQIPIKEKVGWVVYSLKGYI